MTQTTLPAALAPRGSSRRVGWDLLAWRIRRDRQALVAVVILGFVAAAAILAPLWGLQDPLAQNLSGRLAPLPWEAGGTWDHPLGTDQLGRDLLSRVVWGARVSLMVGVSAVVISGLLGLAVGVVSGYFGGALDNVLMRLADAQLAIPFILLVVAVVSVVGPGIQKVIVVIGVTGWVG